MTKLFKKTKQNKKPLDFLKLPFHKRVEGGEPCTLKGSLPCGVSVTKSNARKTSGNP